MTPGGPPSAIDPTLADRSAPPDLDALSKLDALASEHRSARTRESRWDRPPEPRDWRWAVGGIGRVLIAVGILMFAFVGYQLYGTGIQTAQAQNRLEDEFEDLLAGTALSEAGSVDVTTDTTEIPDTVPATVPTSVDPVPTVTTIAAATFVPPAEGEPLAKLAIASINLDKIVIEGVRTNDLADGPGHFPETPLPGQYGNAAIAGHRTTHGQPFNRIDELQVGADIVVTTEAGTYTYVVTGQVIVSPNDYQLVIPTLDPTVATLTLTSCHPKFSAAKRIVVTAVLDPARSDLVTAPYVPLERDPAAPAVIPGDDEVPTSSVAAVTPTIEPVTADTLARQVPSEIDDVLAETTIASQDLFENSWFSDPDAFAQVALWGLALTIVALCATALSRRVRRNWAGVLVGFLPFVVVLYFWFENVNRLLPPNL